MSPVPARPAEPAVFRGWTSPAGRLRAARRGQLLGRAAGLKPGMRVLEIWCGSGIFTRQWAATGAAILAVDNIPEVVRAGAAEEIPGAPRWAVMEAETLALRAGSFDAVVGVSVLHHLDLARALAEMRRVLRPGGRIAFSEPNLLNPLVAAQGKMPGLRRLRGGAPRSTAFTRWAVAAALRRHGFTDIRIVPFDFLHPRTPRRAIPAISRLASAAERIPLLREAAASLHITATRP